MTSPYTGPERRSTPRDSFAGKRRVSTFSYGTFPRPLNTAMDPEERAYVGGIKSGWRYGRAVCSDGIVRRVKLGIADTFFSVPARVKVKGRTIHGIVASLPTALQLANDAPANAHEILAFYAHGKNRNALPSWDDVATLFPPAEVK